MRVLVDDQLSHALSGIAEPVEVRDATGRTYGYYHPTPPVMPDQARPVVSPFSDEELERRRKTPGGRPLAEIWKDLGAQ